MTKYTWEKALRSSLKGVPQEEADSILDYYSELFADKAESGQTEKEIIKSFGNPYDVAYRVVYGVEVPYNSSGIRQPQAEKYLNSSSQKSSGGIGGKILIRLLLFWPFFIVAVTLWSLVIGLGAGGIGGAIGGIGMVIVGFMQMGGNSVGGLSVVGLAIASIGVGIIITLVAFFIFKIVLRLTQKYFFIVKHKTSNNNNRRNNNNE
ncbi:MAG: DUF1700 domain-containing protein [Firmicutes bacterium]|nr:DUF1700 domain-containing protein [Bacillota bacterium]